MHTIFQRGPGGDRVSAQKIKEIHCLWVKRSGADLPAKQSFQIGGIKHFLSTSLSIPIYTLSPPFALLSASLSINLPSSVHALPIFHSATIWMLARQKLRKHTVNIYLTNSRDSPNIHILYVHSHRAVINGWASGLCLMKRYRRSVWRESGELLVPARPLTDSHHTTSAVENLRLSQPQVICDQTSIWAEYTVA